MNRWLRLVSIIVILGATVLLIRTNWPDHQFHLWVLDVGQGDAILVQTPAGHQILIDGGPTDRVLPELGRHMPFWDRTIEQVILTHNHADHVTGLIEVARRYQIGKVWISGATYATPEYLSWTTLLRDKQIPTEIVWAGKDQTIDGMNLHVLFPLTNQTGINPPNQHDANLVTKLTYRGETMLLTGDIEFQHETAMLAALCPEHQTPCPALAADFLKVPHHGSKTGLLPEFLAAVAPKIAVISCGPKNPYGHPAPVTLDRLETAGIQIFRTDQQGTIATSLVNQKLHVWAEGKRI